MASYGAKDRADSDTATRLERVLTAVGIDHDVKEYPDAGHAFLNDHDPADVPFLFVVMSKFAGGGGYPGPSADARGRIVSFFDVHLSS